MYTIAVHHSRGVEHIDCVDEDRYSFIDLTNDAAELGGVRPGNCITIKYRIPGTRNFSVVDGDAALMHMFSLYRGLKEIYVELIEEETPVLSQMRSDNAASSGFTGSRSRYEQGGGAEATESTEDEDWINEEILISDNEGEEEESEEEVVESPEVDVAEDSEEGVEGNEEGAEGSEEGGDHLSNCESDPDYRSPYDSDEDSESDGIEFDAEHGMDDPKFERGMQFSNIHEFRRALAEFAIREGFNLKRIKNEKKRVTVGCAVAGCTWRLHASTKPDGTTYMIKTFQPEHTCTRVHNNVEANSRWISKKILPQVRANPKVQISTIREMVQSKYGIEPSNMQLRRARRKAIEVVEGSHGLSYGLLWRYAEIIRATNPGSLVKIESERLDISSASMFKRIFISFAAMRLGLLHGCRPFIGLDGCHLKGPYGGVLLSAVALDGNGGLFPVAYAVVEAETYYSWSFFLQNLYVVIGVVDRAWTLITDRQKGILKAIGEVLPHVNQRYCARHMYSNFKTLHKGLLLKNLFWAAVRAYNVYDFNDAMERMKNASLAAYNWLKEIPVETWSRHAFDKRVRNDHVTNNLSESFNQWIGDLREKPILALLDGIRTRWMVKIQKRHQTASTWTTLVPPRVCATLEVRKKAARSCSILFAGGDEYEVVDSTGRYIVKMGGRTCTCLVWDLCGIPCKHAIQCMIHRRDNPENHCDPCYTVEAYLRAYGEMLHPIPDDRMWPTVDTDPLMAPRLRRLTGRPRKNRRKEIDEPRDGSQIRRSSTLRCCICGGFGHNRRTCQRGPTKAKSKASTSGDTQRIDN